MNRLFLVIFLIHFLAQNTFSSDSCRYLFDEEIIAGARRLHTTWQETTKHPTRYRLAQEFDGRVYPSLESYFQAQGTPKNLKKYYRLNRENQVEEDIRQVPYDRLSRMNQLFSLRNAESIAEQVDWLLQQKLRTSDSARQAILHSLQRIHLNFLNFSSRRYQRSYSIELIALDLRVSNALPLARELIRKRDPKNFFHLFLEKSIEEYISALQADQFLRYTEMPVQQAYFRMLNDRGQRLPLEELARQYFDLSMPPVVTDGVVPDRKNEEAAKAFIYENLREEIQAVIPDAKVFTLERPETFTGSYAFVFIIKNTKLETIGAVKVQSRENRGLEEVLSSLASSEFVQVSRKEIEMAKPLSFGRLTESTYFLIYQPALEHDLDWWLLPRNASIVQRTNALSASARIVATLHENKAEITKDTVNTLKANILYDVREALTYLDTPNLEMHLQKGHLDRASLHFLRNSISKATRVYDRILEHRISSFKPSMIHGDLHGGNIFYDSRTNKAKFIDLGDMSWFIGKQDQSTGDPSNDLGRFLGHLLISDVKANRVSQQSFINTKYFYERYLGHRGIRPGSPEEQVLHSGTLFYMHRYFTRQATDWEGRKFKSPDQSQDSLFTLLFKTWERLTESLP